MTTQTIAAIDIGSNAIRLMVSNVEIYRENSIKKVAMIRVPIRLGEDVFSHKSISSDKIARLKDAMSGFASLMKAYEVKLYRACATSAMREAENSQQVLCEIKNCCDIDIDIISGTEEADLIFAAGESQTIMEPGKSYMYIDVGGGSTEVIVYSGNQKVKSHSFELGTVRMLSGNVDKEMDNYKSWLKKQTLKYSPIAIIGSGGNINKIQRLVGKKDRESVSSAELKVIYDTLKLMSYEQRVETLSLNQYRADVILPAAKIIHTASKITGVQHILIPRLGLADGIISQLAQKLQPVAMSIME